MCREIVARKEVRAYFPAYRARKISKIIFTSMCSNVDSDVPFMHIFMPEVNGKFYTGLLVNKYFFSHACRLLNNDTMSCCSNTLHCKEIATQLGIKHDICYLSKKWNNNVSLDVNIDDDCVDLKRMCCIVAGKSMKNVRDARRIIVEISKVIMKEEDTLNTCKNILRRVRAKCDIMNDEITEENECAIEKDNDNVNAIQENIIECANRKERDYKPYLMLSTRRKKHRIR